MNGGGFDLVTASGDATRAPDRRQYRAGGQTDLIPSWNTVDPRLQNGAWHTVNGHHYGVPYQWGPNVLMYNTKVFKDPPKSWNVVFEEMTLPDGKSNKGRVQAYYGPIYIADAALYLKAHAPNWASPIPMSSTRSSLTPRRAAARPAPDRPEVLERHHPAEAGLHLRGRGRCHLLALSGQSAARQQQAADRQRDPGGRGHGLGRYDHDACSGPASELRLHVARAFALAETPGRPRRLVRQRPGGARGLQGQRAARRHRLQDQRRRQLRQDQLLAHAGRRLWRRADLRTVQGLGQRLSGDPERSVERPSRAGQLSRPRRCP